MVRSGMITQAQVLRTLHQQGTHIYRCPMCGAQYNVSGDPREITVTCPNDGQALELVTPDTCKSILFSRLLQGRELSPGEESPSIPDSLRQSVPIPVVDIRAAAFQADAPEFFAELEGSLHIQRGLLLSKANALTQMGRLDESDALLERVATLTPQAATRQSWARTMHTPLLVRALNSWYRGLPEARPRDASPEPCAWRAPSSWPRWPPDRPR